MWIRTCIILHNLILQLEDRDGIDTAWRDELLALGSEDPREEAMETDSDGAEVGQDAELRRAHRRHTSPGQRFRVQLMDRLFDSPHTTAVRNN